MCNLFRNAFYICIQKYTCVCIVFSFSFFFFKVRSVPSMRLELMIKSHMLYQLTQQGTPLQPPQNTLYILILKMFTFKHGIEEKKSNSNTQRQALIIFLYIYLYSFSHFFSFFDIFENNISIRPEFQAPSTNSEQFKTDYH